MNLCAPAGEAAASSWVRRWMHLLPPGARVLDVACGGGRHARLIAGAGHRVTALDRDRAALDALATVAGVEQRVQADLEGAPWPLAQHEFDLVLVTNYLWRPLWPARRAAVAPGGLLVVETFARAQAMLGRPQRPEFLLRPGELLGVAGVPRAPLAEDEAAEFGDPAGWHVIAYEEGRLGAPSAGAGAGAGRAVQRIVARRGGGAPERRTCLGDLLE